MGLSVLPSARKEFLQNVAQFNPKKGFLGKQIGGEIFTASDTDACVEDAESYFPPEWLIRHIQLSNEHPLHMLSLNKSLRERLMGSEFLNDATKMENREILIGLLGRNSSMWKGVGIGVIAQIDYFQQIIEQYQHPLSNPNESRVLLSLLINRVVVQCEEEYVEVVGMMRKELLVILLKQSHVATQESSGQGKRHALYQEHVVVQVREKDICADVAVYQIQLRHQEGVISSQQIEQGILAENNCVFFKERVFPFKQCASPIRHSNFIVSTQAVPNSLPKKEKISKKSHPTQHVVLNQLLFFTVPANTPHEIEILFPRLLAPFKKVLPKTKNSFFQRRVTAKNEFFIEIDLVSLLGLHNGMDAFSNGVTKGMIQEGFIPAKVLKKTS